MKKRPADATPDIHEFQAPPQSTEELINRYGTYNIQPTADTADTFPLIAPGLPRRYRNMKLGKRDLEGPLPFDSPQS